MAVMTVWLSRITEDSERFLAECARVSRHGQGKPSDIKKDRATIRRLIRDGHESVLEHASATFLIEGISRCCMAQLLRHRICEVIGRAVAEGASVLIGGHTGALVYALRAIRDEEWPEFVIFETQRVRDASDRFVFQPMGILRIPGG